MEQSSLITGCETYQYAAYRSALKQSTFLPRRTESISLPSRKERQARKQPMLSSLWATSVYMMHPRTSSFSTVKCFPTRLWPFSQILSSISLIRLLRKANRCVVASSRVRLSARKVRELLVFANVCLGELTSRTRGLTSKPSTLKFQEKDVHSLRKKGSNLLAWISRHYLSSVTTETAVLRRSFPRTSTSLSSMGARQTLKRASETLAKVWQKPSQKLLASSSVAKVCLRKECDQRYVNPLRRWFFCHSTRTSRSTAAKDSKTSVGERQFILVKRLCRFSRVSLHSPMIQRRHIASKSLNCPWKYCSRDARRTSFIESGVGAWVSPLLLDGRPSFFEESCSNSGLQPWGVSSLAL